MTGWKWSIWLWCDSRGWKIEQWAQEDAGARFGTRSLWLSDDNDHEHRLSKDDDGDDRVSEGDDDDNRLSEDDDGEHDMDDMDGDQSNNDYHTGRAQGLPVDLTPFWLLSCVSYVFFFCPSFSVLVGDNSDHLWHLGFFWARQLHFCLPPHAKSFTIRRFLSKSRNGARYSLGQRAQR
jgi:hypothetical protein